MTPALALVALVLAEPVTVAHVHDGDSFALTDGRRVRVADYDSPELRCTARDRKRGRWCDRTRALAAKAEATRLLFGGRVTLARVPCHGGRALTYGRVCAVVWIDGRPLGDEMVRRKLGRR